MLIIAVIEEVALKLRCQAVQLFSSTGESFFQMTSEVSNAVKSIIVL